MAAAWATRLESTQPMGSAWEGFGVFGVVLLIFQGWSGLRKISVYFLCVLLGRCWVRWEFAADLDLIWVQFLRGGYT